jgi:predicted dienelactone hydrolase
LSVTVAAVALAACGDGARTAGQSEPTAPTPSTATTVPPPSTPVTTNAPPLTVDRRTGVGERTMTFVDASRPTSANGSFPGASDRTFPVTIWYPAGGDLDAAAVVDAAPDRAGGPYPLVVFAHGYAVTAQYYAELLRRWAAAGYVVAAPTYPLLSGGPGGGASHDDYEMSFADTTFVITELLRTFDGVGIGSDALTGIVDANSVGVAGHSDGEVVAYGLGFLSCCRDPRVKSVVAMAGNLGNIANPVQRDTGVPIMHVIGEADELEPYSTAIEYDRDELPVPKWSVTLVDGTHAPPYRSPSSPHFDGVVAMTTDFWDGTLKGRPDRLARIDTIVSSAPNLFRLER